MNRVITLQKTNISNKVLICGKTEKEILFMTSLKKSYLKKVFTPPSIRADRWVVEKSLSGLYLRNSRCRKLILGRYIG